MALKLNERYPGRFDNPSSDYPQGAFKNRSTPTSKDGSYLERDWANDQLAFFASLLDGAGLEANGEVDKVGNCQAFDALSSIIVSKISGFTRPYPDGFLFGLKIENDNASPNTTVIVGPGSSRDSSNFANISLATSIRGVIQATGSWAAGDNQGKLLVGARSANTWYHVFVIGSSSGSNDDIAFHTAISPSGNLPTGYDRFRRIGSIRTNGSGNIIAFVMNISASGMRRVSWITPIMDVNQVTLGATAVLYAISSPPGLVVEARLNTFSYANNSVVYFSDPATNDLLPSNSIDWPGFSCGYGAVSNSSLDSLGALLSVNTNTSSQIRARANAAGNVVSILNLGWDE